MTTGNVTLYYGLKVRSLFRRRMLTVSATGKTTKETLSLVLTRPKLWDEIDWVDISFPSFVKAIDLRFAQKRNA
jgi:hypothetical protein